MVALEVIRKANEGIAKLPAGLVAVFLGGTSGIGQSTLEQLASHAVRPRIYIVARRAAAVEPLLADLRQRNAEGTYTVVEKDVSLVRETDDVVAFVRQHESQVDLLFASVGFISFAGRIDTDEGLEPSMTTRYYSRLRAVQGLLPLLEQSPAPRVVAILAGGQEGAIQEDDLDLRKPGHYSIASSATQSTTMLTLSFEHLAREHPRISFVHAFPGIVKTPLLGRGSTGVLGLLMRNVVAPLVGVFATPVADAGARALFYATNDRYAAKGASPLVPRPEGVDASPVTPGGIFLSNEKSESVDNEGVLGDLRARKIDDKIWEHTNAIFDECVEKAKAKNTTGK